MYATQRATQEGPLGFRRELLGSFVFPGVAGGSLDAADNVQETPGAYQQFAERLHLCRASFLRVCRCPHECMPHNEAT